MLVVLCIIFFTTLFPNKTNYQGNQVNESQPPNASQIVDLQLPASIAQPQQTSIPSPLPQQLRQANRTSSTSSPIPPVAASQTVLPPGVKVSQLPDQQASTLSAIGVPPQRMASASPSAQQQHQQQTFGNQLPSRGAPSTFPGSLSDLVASFENMKQKGKHWLWKVPDQDLERSLQHHTEWIISIKYINYSTVASRVCLSHWIPRST